MALFMLKVRYSRDSVTAMVAKPQDRRGAAQSAYEAVGGKLHQMFFALGEWDVYVIGEAPDANASAALSMALSASGAVAAVETVSLLTTDDAMAAMKKAGEVAKRYRPPSA